MWIFSKHGFFSIVCDTRHPGTFLVRGRRRAHVVWIAGALGRLPIEVARTPDADYPYRLSVDATELTCVAVAAAKSVDYSNFKSAAGAVGAYGPKGSIALADTWAAVRETEDAGARARQTPQTPRPLHEGVDRFVEAASKVDVRRLERAVTVGAKRAMGELGPAKKPRSRRKKAKPAEVLPRTGRLR